MDALIADFDREVHNNTLSGLETERTSEHVGVNTATSYYTNALITAGSLVTNPT